MDDRVHRTGCGDRVGRNRIRHQGSIEDVNEFGSDIEVELTLRAEPEIPADVSVLGRCAGAAKIFVIHRGRRTGRVLGHGAQAAGFSTWVVYGLKVL